MPGSAYPEPFFCYRERVARFWNWFARNEARLSEYSSNMGDYESEEVVAFFAEGLGQAIEGGLFELGGRFEVSLASDGDLSRLLLGEYLCRNMPPEYSEKWTFAPWKRALPQGSLHFDGLRLSAEDLFVYPERIEGESRFDLRFYCKPLLDLEEEQAYHVFFLLMEMCLGENICLAFVGEVEMAERKAEGMFPLSSLLYYMRKEFEAEGRDLPEDYNPALVYSGYSMDPQEEHEGGPGRPLRTDIVAGFTRLTDLLDDYYGEEGSPLFESLSENGVKAVFLSLPRLQQEEFQLDLDLRNEIADRLEDEVLGEAGSGREIGILLGQAMGLDYSYIDLLLYDEQAFLERVGKVLADYPQEVLLHEFRFGSPGLNL